MNTMFFQELVKLVSSGWQAEVQSNGLVILRNPHHDPADGPNHWDPFSAVWKHLRGLPRRELDKDFNLKSGRSADSACPTCNRYQHTVAADEIGLPRDEFRKLLRVSTAYFRYLSEGSLEALQFALALKLPALPSEAE